MKRRSLYSISILLFFCACVDRITFDTGLTNYPVVVSGNITSDPGPYVINVTRAFDIESKISTRVALSVKKMTMSDNHGESEVLEELKQGTYTTAVGGIRGKLGYAYSLRVELLDGRIYESIPDTLSAPGTVDDVHYSFRSDKDKNGIPQPVFDVAFNSTSGGKNSFYFMWRFIGTYQIETNPELHTEICGEAPCARPRECSAYALNSDGVLEEVKPCECCRCWVSIFNDIPVVSDDQFVEGGKFNNVYVASVPVNGWTFDSKVNAQVKQYSLSPRAFRFYKGIQTQKLASSSLFQPLSGKIPGNFVQVSGSPAPLEGLFFATSVSSKSTFITRDALPRGFVIEGEPTYPESCIEFGNATNVRPDFWID